MALNSTKQKEIIRTMHILIVTQWFQPEPHYKGLNFALGLKSRGHNVEVLTGFPNYPGGKVYKNYKLSPFRREVMEGIHVNRCWLYPSHDRSAIRRAANYISFAATTTIASFFLKKPDVVYIYTPPMTATLAALAIKIFRGVPYVVDVQDLWPDTLASTGMVRSKGLLSVVGWFSNLVFKRASRIIVLSDGFRHQLVRRGIDTPIAVIRNWSPPEIVENCRTPILPRPGDIKLRPFNVLFAGNIGLAQGLDVVIDTARLLRDQGITVIFSIVGGGVDLERLKGRADREALEHIHFHDYRHPAEMAALFSEADALLVHLRRDRLFEITIPSKTQAYLAVGKPILMGVRGDAANLIEEAGAGIPFEPESPESLAAAVGELIALSAEERAKMGEAGAEYYDNYLSFEVGMGKIEKELQKAVQEYRAQI